MKELKFLRKDLDIKEQVLIDDVNNFRKFKSYQ